MDNGHTWSTPWVIDDPKIYVIPPPGQQVAQLYRVKKQPQKPQQKQVAKNRPQQQGPNGQRSASRQSSPSLQQMPQ